MPTAVPAPPPLPLSVPHLALSLHAWDDQYDNPASKGEKPNARFTAHLDALAALAEMGVISRVRVDMGWSTSQPNAGSPDSSHWYNRRFERLFGMLAERGVVPYVVVHQSPTWARKGGAASDPKQFPVDPTSIMPWAEWVTHRYRRWVTEWEVWNEPNLAEFAGAGNNTPERYVPLLRAFAAGAAVGNPNAKLIGGNVSQSDWSWIDRAYRAGMGSLCDIVGVHPYQGNQGVRPSSLDTSGIAKFTGSGADIHGWEKARIAKGFPLIGQVMAKYGDAAKPVWVTEVGWSASPTGVGPAGVGSTWQGLTAKAAEYVVEFLEMVASRKDGQVWANTRLVTLYEVFNPQPGASPHQKGFAFLYATGGLKPQGQAIVRWTRSRKPNRALH